MIETARLILRAWSGEDREAFALMCSDPEVMVDYGYIFDRAQSDMRVDRYDAACRNLGYGRWAVIRKADSAFLGSCGILPAMPEFPLAPALEIGWRFNRFAWGQGYASEAARAALKDGFALGLTEVWSYTSSTNARSEAVMRRIGLTRAAEHDYADHGQSWVVYVARPGMLTSPP